MPKPCCQSPRLRFVGRAQCDRSVTIGVLGIDYYECLNCRQSVTRFLDSKDKKARLEPTPIMNAEPPDVMPRCCLVAMEWLGRESVSTGQRSLSYDAFRCRMCARMLRVPLAGSQPDDD